MVMVDQDLEQQREDFLRRLAGDVEQFAGEDRYLAYWNAVEHEARTIEDMGRLDTWVRELRRDRDKLQELKARKSTAASSQVGAEVATRLISVLLALIDDIERRLLKRLSLLRDRFGSWVYLLGPGMKQKPVPKDADSKEDDKAADRAQQDALNQRARPKVEPTKKLDA